MKNFRRAIVSAQPSYLGTRENHFGNGTFSKYYDSGQNCNRAALTSAFFAILQNLCWGENLFILNSCRFSAMSESLDQLNSSAGELCKGQRNFNAEHLTYGMPHLAKNFLNFVHSIQGKENYFVVLGVGKSINKSSLNILRFV